MQAVKSRQSASKAAMRRRGGFVECIARIVYHAGGANQPVSDPRDSADQESARERRFSESVLFSVPQWFSASVVRLIGG